MKATEAKLLDFLKKSPQFALPARLFLTTGIPACLWFLTRDKTGRNLKQGGRDRKGETLFTDARKLGTMQTRTLRVLTSGDHGEQFVEKLKRLTAPLRKQQAETAKRDAIVIAAPHLRIQAVRLRALSVNPVLTSGNRTRSADTQTSEFTACR